MAIDLDELDAMVKRVVGDGCRRMARLYLGSTERRELGVAVALRYDTVLRAPSTDEPVIEQYAGIPIILTDHADDGIYLVAFGEGG